MPRCVEFVNNPTPNLHTQNLCQCEKPKRLQWHCEEHTQYSRLTGTWVQLPAGMSPARAAHDAGNSILVWECIVRLAASLKAHLGDTMFAGNFPLPACHDVGCCVVRTYLGQVCPVCQHPEADTCRKGRHLKVHSAFETLGCGPCGFTPAVLVR